MSSPKFLGITFRSANHMYWFRLNIIMLGACIIISAILVFLKVWSLAIPILIAFGTTSALTAITAIIVTRFGKENGPYYSKDCIWFNGLLAGIYFAGMCLVLFLEK